MDISKWFTIAKNVPKEKLQTDDGLKEVLREISKKTGKTLTEAELNFYVSQFRQISKTQDVSSLMDKLAKSGMKASDIDQLKKRFKK